MHAFFCFLLLTPAFSGNQPHLLLVACFSLFAGIFAWLAFRVQPFPVFAGLAAVQALTFFYFTLLFAGLLLPLPLVAFALSQDWSSVGFFLLLSVHWLSLALFSPRQMLPASARSFLGQWSIYMFVSLAMIFGLGLLENFARRMLTAELHHLIRQVSAGLAAGILLVAALILAYRNLSKKQALWFWLFAAAVLAALAVTLHYQIPAAPLLQIGAMSASSVFLIFGLLADRARFLQLESELRRNLMDNAGHWEMQAQQLHTVLARGSEAIVHLDFEERITFASPTFVALLEAKTEDLASRPLKTVLPRPFYDAILPALQDARREHASHFYINLQPGPEEKDAKEKVLQVSYAPLLNERQKVRGVHLGLVNISNYDSHPRTAPKQHAEEMRRLRLVEQCMENVAEAIAVTDAQYRIVHVNDAFARATGSPRHDLQGLNVQKVREKQPYPWDKIQPRLAQNKPWRGEIISRDPDGREYARDLSVIPVADRELHSSHYLWIERDVAARAIAQHTQELERRVEQISKLLKFSENIRLNQSLEIILQSVAAAIHTDWQRVAVYHAKSADQFELMASAGFEEKNAVLPRKFRKLGYADFAPYLLDKFRLSSSFFIDSSQLAEKRPQFMPKELEVFQTGEWREHDCLLVPIGGRDRYAGMIAVFCPREGKRPRQEEVRHLEAFADDVAIAIENSGLIASHANKERQLRALNRIGNTFRAAGTLEQVLAEIAGLLGEAMSRPAVIAMQTPRSASAENDQNGNALLGTRWRAASGPKRKGGSEGQLLELSVDDENLFSRIIGLALENEICDLELSGKELQSLIKLPGAQEENARYRASLIALRSRQENFGCVFWVKTPGEADWDEEQRRYGHDLLAQAALTIDNARLFLQTEDKARALEHANQHIAEFLASVSHELRTPLHAILQFSEIMLSEKPGALNDNQKRQMKIVQHGGKNLLNLINDILDLSKIEAGKMEASWEEFNPAYMIRETVAALRPLGLSKGLDPQLRLSPALPEQMVSDRHMLARVLTNLLGNAIKFTDQGEVKVAAEYRNRVLALSVSDSGKGIPAPRLQEIFEPFRQLESGEARKHGGTGLGLAISQKLMGILGGRIEVRSTEGKGSTFTMQLPIREFKPEAQKRRKKEAPSPAAGDQKTANRKGLFARWRPSAKKKEPTILVVEDDDSTRYAMEFILEDAGYQVSFAENGEKALLAAQHERPDLILMDIMMPNLDGYQVARMLKAQKQLQHIPLVALTARAMKGDREKALAAGYDDYLTKPFEKKDILAVIARWLGESVKQ